MSDAWSPVHHEDIDQEPEPPETAARATKAAKKPDTDTDGPALILTIPPNMIAGLWSLAEALKENTAATRELISELQAMRPQPTA